MHADIKLCICVQRRRCGTLSCCQIPHVTGHPGQQYIVTQACGLQVCEAALYGADNILMCAPTGAGKTNVAMLTILNTMHANMREDGSLNLQNFKIVYVAPMKVQLASSICASFQ